MVYLRFGIRFDPNSIHTGSPRTSHLMAAERSIERVTVLVKLAGPLFNFPDLGILIEVECPELQSDPSLSGFGRCLHLRVRSDPEAWSLFTACRACRRPGGRLGDPKPKYPLYSGVTARAEREHAHLVGDGGWYYCQPSFGSPGGAENLLQEVRLPGVPVCQASVNARVRVYRLANVTVMNFLRRIGRNFTHTSAFNRTPEVFASSPNRRCTAPPGVRQRDHTERATPTRLDLACRSVYYASM